MSITVLVIDDDHDVADVFAEYLKIKGMDIVGVVYDGQKGIELYKKVHPDIVLTDVMMPTYDGYYVLQGIRESDPNAKIIFVTASLSPDSISQMKESSPSAIVNKPYRMDELIKIIHRVKEGEIGIFPTNDF